MFMKITVAIGRYDRSLSDLSYFRMVITSYLLSRRDSTTCHDQEFEAIRCLRTLSKNFMSKDLRWDFKD